MIRSLSLATERLALTPLAGSDVDALLTVFREPAVRRYLLDDALVDRDWVLAEVETSAARFATGGLGLWIARDRVAGDVIGFAGFRPFYDPPIEQLVYGVATAATGRGLATEMARAVIELAFRDPARAVIRASTDEPNQASVRVLERLGFTELGRTPGERWIQLHFSRARGPAFPPGSS